MTTQAKVSDDALLGRSLRTLLSARDRLGPSDLNGIVEVVGGLLGADAVRLHVADYAMREFQVLGRSGPVSGVHPMAGTMAGRCFAGGETLASESSWWVPLVEGTERMGVLELEFGVLGDDPPDLVDELSAMLVLLVSNLRRYTDVWLRSRRAQPLSAAAEAQWDLLPPLASTTDRVAVTGILEPAYEIGGDSFDYAINPDRVDFAIIDAVGHGMSAVLMSTAVINSLRNSRREQTSIEDAYRQADRLIHQHFGRSNYVTGQFGSLDLNSGLLTWMNAGHMLPMLVRDGSYVGELACPPSMPMGLGGQVVAVSREILQRDDRVLFYTDGITESLDRTGRPFGHDRLTDFFLRATLDGLPAAETARRLSAAVVAHVGDGLNDDATLLLLEYRQPSDVASTPRQ